MLQEEQSFHNYDTEMDLTRTRWMTLFPSSIPPAVCYHYYKANHVDLSSRSEILISIFRDDPRLASPDSPSLRIVVAAESADRIKKARVNDGPEIFNAARRFIGGGLVTGSRHLIL